MRVHRSVNVSRLMLTVVILAGGIGAQQHATPKDGVTVILLADGRWEAAPAQPRGAPPSVQPSPVRAFFGNLHSHTAYTDGRGTPADAYEHGRHMAGLDLLAMTEQNYERAGYSRIAGDHDGVRLEHLPALRFGS